jgi:two-component SAPR family response regulator
LDLSPLKNKRLLVVEDEFLIAMDVEQLCREHGAAEIITVGNLQQLGTDPFSSFCFDAAVMDVIVGGSPTIDFARQLVERKIPFIFATGYSDRDDIFAGFPDITVVPKPYAGDDLVAALGRAISQLERKDADE